jgi:hypothetical protein
VRAISGQKPDSEKRGAIATALQLTTHASTEAAPSLSISGEASAP